MDNQNTEKVLSSSIQKDDIKLDELKISGGLKEDGIVVGNAYNKYGSSNVIVRQIMAGFESVISGFVNKVAPESIHEIGCGEGYWTLKWLKQGINTRGSDFSQTVIEMAQLNALIMNYSKESFKVQSIYDLKSEVDAAQLIVCCEVLEHLEYPEEALKILATLVDPYLIISVPREPIWSVLNMIRGKYLNDWGNTPGHIQRWSKTEFVELVSRYFDILEIRSPLPWTVLLCRRKQD